MAGTFHFRSTPELDELIDAEVQRLRKEGAPPRIANRSAVVRVTLMNNLGESEHKAVLSEIFKEVYGVTRAVAEQAVYRTMEALPGLLDEQLGTLDEA